MGEPSSTPQTGGASPPERQGNPLVVAALMLGLFGAMAGVVVWQRSSVVHGGALALDVVQRGQIDGVGTQGARVPGRELNAGDVADVWTINLEAHQAYTIQVCTPSSTRRRYNPSFVVQGPAGASGSGTPLGGTPNDAAEVYTPAQGGAHAIYVYKPFNHNGGDYRIRVTRGARREADASLCM